MHGSEQLLDYYNLSTVFQQSHAKSLGTIEAALEYLNSLSAQLFKCGFLEDSQHIDAFMAKLKDADPSSKLQANEHWREYHNVTCRAWDTITRELPRQKAVVLDDSPVIRRLHSQLSKLKHEEEVVMLGEAIRCLEVGAYRSATVMEWCVAFDHVRRWIYYKPRNKKKFNSYLTANTKNAPIALYDDFYKLGEYNVISCAYSAKMFKKQMNDILDGALKERNHFAHPSGRIATSATAAGYLENLLINVLDNNFFST
jgi:hypothetical protein